MNEQLRQRAQEIADEHSNDAYSVALAMLEREIKIKADAFREVGEKLRYEYEGYYSQGDIEAFFDSYANKLENLLWNKRHDCDDEPCGGGNADTYSVKLDCGCVVTKSKLENQND